MEVPSSYAAAELNWNELLLINVPQIPVALINVIDIWFSLKFLSVA